MLKSNINSIQFINPSFSPKISVAFVNTFTSWSLFKILEIWEFSTKLLPLPGPSELLMANKQVTSLPKQLAKLDIKCPSRGFKDLIPNSSLWIRSFTESKNATHLYNWTKLFIHNFSPANSKSYEIMGVFSYHNGTSPRRFANHVGKGQTETTRRFLRETPIIPKLPPSGIPAPAGLFRDTCGRRVLAVHHFGGFTHREIIHGQEGHNIKVSLKNKANLLPPDCITLIFGSQHLVSSSFQLENTTPLQCI